MKKQEEYFHSSSNDFRNRKKNSFHIGSGELSWNEDGEKVRKNKKLLYLYYFYKIFVI